MRWLEFFLGGAHGSQPLPLTPLMPECETELRFKFSGRVEGLTERACTATGAERLNLKHSVFVFHEGFAVHPHNAFDVFQTAQPN
jgi:hypothetical protein